MAETPAPQPIPVRLWTDPLTFYLGYLTFGEPETVGETVKYNMQFEGAPLHEPPRFDVRIYVQDRRT
jgi:hypothetical protein